MYEQICYEIDKKILTITLNRPDKLNAFTATMMGELIDAFKRANADDDVRAIVVTGAGRAFCAGADLASGAKAFERSERHGNETSVRAGQGIDYSHESVRDGAGRVTLEIFKCLKPVIGAINGSAVGVGITMTLAMDIRLVAEGSKLGFVFARRGIVPEGASAWFLPRIVGVSKALEWSISGRLISTDEALQSGLVRSVHARGDLLAAAYEIASDIVDNVAPVSAALTRQMIWRCLGEAHPMAAHRIDSRAVFARGRTPDAVEGVMSFLEKRSPSFPCKVSDGMPDFYPWFEEPPYS